MPPLTVVQPVLSEVIAAVANRLSNRISSRSLRTLLRPLSSLIRADKQASPPSLPRLTLALLALLSTLCLPLTASAQEEPTVSLSTTHGDIVLKLDAARAPQTVKNFLEYVDSGFYKDTLFHRVIEGFMIQGGGFNQQFHKKLTRPPVNNEAYNGLHNRRYSIAMARTTAPHSATSQFFINSKDNSNLLDHTSTTQRGWGYTVFGHVIEGQDVVDAISRVHTGAGGPLSRDVPLEPVIILSAERYVDEKKIGSAQPISNTLNNTPPLQADGPVSVGKSLQPIEQN